tara:strand:+ start:1469 stop:2614 length:1146 start_codon:yes stop_codon:yes gene_type:complete
MNKIDFNMPEADYFAYPAASNSTLGRMKRSAAHCLSYMTEPFTPTPSMRLGSVAHKLILEGEAAFKESFYIAQEHDPSLSRKQIVRDIIASIQSESFNDLYIVDDGSKVNTPTGDALVIAETLLSASIHDIPKLFAVTPTDINKRTKGGKEEYAEFQAKCERENLKICKQEHLDKACEYVNWLNIVGMRVVIKNDDYVNASNYVKYLDHVGNKTIATDTELELARDIKASVMTHPTASKLLSSGRPEVSIFWEDTETGYQCKSRIDWIHNDYLVDLKTTGDASLEEFSRSIAKFGYHRQNAMYFDGYEQVNGAPAKGFIFIAVETKPPHAVGVYNLDLDGVAQGRTEYKELLGDFKQCKQSQVWPAYSEQVETIELPRWYK